MKPYFRCCGTDQTWAGPRVTVPRGRPRRMVTSRVIMHVRGTDRFWHWEDQRAKLVEARATANGGVEYLEAR